MAYISTNLFWVLTVGLHVFMCQNFKERILCKSERVGKLQYLTRGELMRFSFFFAASFIRALIDALSIVPFYSWEPKMLKSTTLCNWSRIYVLWTPRVTSSLRGSDEICWKGAPWIKFGALFSTVDCLSFQLMCSITPYHYPQVSSTPRSSSSSSQHKIGHHENIVFPRILQQRPRFIHSSISETTHKLFLTLEDNTHTSVA